MNIILPKTPFSFNDGAAVVETDILYIYRQVDFYSLMSELTYATFGRETCYYCGRPIQPSKLTVDHKIPRCFGGPTLTNNLAPSCKHCNSRKGNMFEDEFFKIMKMEANHEDVSAFKAEVEKRQKRIYKGKIDVIPEEWLHQGKVNVVTIRYQLNEPLGTGFYRTKRVFDRHNSFLKPIIISSNRYLLDGFNVCLLAKIYDKSDKLQIIRLDNVICMY